ncbi:MAG: 4-(cytidine 5'-diphospho)-2-C-methyl-D-erythritol kinase [Candidatus Aegiribacteria sp.]|nr:4-(cytidine 5'-diphospho)-2-C-methyl-D-erythritol kinase [Candidatus Aegiribacteria sp.]MBD3294773.1 4-(cytidine 5'-diphospho)-2-C-methyl-D-erythritol kinase [Candidatus Fermentibacteria bacterium]
MQHTPLDNLGCCCGYPLPGNRDCSALRITVKACAKINLGLRILGLRQDGFHDIRSVFQEISLHDTVTLDVREGRGEISLHCSSSEIPSDSSNLVWKAAELFQSFFHSKLDVRIELEKRIPSRAGLGGGSSDAAAVLRGLAELKGVDSESLVESSAELGSDVPFFMTGGTALVEGRGERIAHIPGIPFHAVLIHPNTSVSTPWAYEMWDKEANTYLTDSGLIRHYSASSAVWHEGKPFPLELRNDFLPLLEKHIPEITEVSRYLADAKCSNWGLSGSGPTFYVLFRRAGEACDFSRNLQWDFTICRSAETAGASSNG